MNPKLPLQKFFEYVCKETDIFPAKLIDVYLNKWKKDYELMCEIETQNKCQICNKETHWIKKLNCPQKVYSEGFKFKTLYEQLEKVIDIAKCNKDYRSLYENYIPKSENEEKFDLWVQEVINHKSKIDDLRFELFDGDFFICDENGDLLKVKPGLSDKFEFEIFIEPDNFIDLYKLFKLMDSC